MFFFVFFFLLPTAESVGSMSPEIEQLVRGGLDKSSRGALVFVFPRANLFCVGGGVLGSTPFFRVRVVEKRKKKSLRSPQDSKGRLLFGELGRVPRFRSWA